jgi:hypothetical protein
MRARRGKRCAEARNSVGWPVRPHGRGARTPRFRPCRFRSSPIAPLLSGLATRPTEPALEICTPYSARSYFALGLRGLAHCASPTKAAPATQLSFWIVQPLTRPFSRWRPNCWPSQRAQSSFRVRELRMPGARLEPEGTCVGVSQSTSEGRDGRQHEIVPQVAKDCTRHLRTLAEWRVRRQVAIRADGGSDFERPSSELRDANARAFWLGGGRGSGLTSGITHGLPMV